MSHPRRQLLVTSLLSLLANRVPATLAKAANVSMIGLIATPERFHGKRVVVAGVARLEFEGTVLYFHREGYENLDAMNSVWLSIGSEKVRAWRALNGRLVSVVGTFRSGRSGHMGVYGAAIDVESLEPITPLPGRPK